MILRRRAQQARAADVDHLDRLFERAVRLGDRFFERVQVDHHHVDRLDALLGELAHVVGVVAIGEDGRVDPGMQRFYAAVEHLGEAGDLLDEGDREARFAEVPGRAAGRDELDAELLDEGSGEVGDARLVINGDECPFDPDVRHDEGSRYGSAVANKKRPIRRIREGRSWRLSGNPGGVSRQLSIIILIVIVIVIIIIVVYVVIVILV